MTIQSRQLAAAFELLAILVLTVRSDAAGPAKFGIAGKVVDVNDKPVEAACVLLCEQESGAPLTKDTSRTLIQDMIDDKWPLELAFQVTGQEGRFAFEDLPAGEYRLIAQSWIAGAQPFKGPLEVNGTEVVLRGVADHVRVTDVSSPEVVIRPLGTGGIAVRLEDANDDSLLVLSTSPTRVDPILGFVGWGGPFLENMLGGNRGPKGVSVVRGLPEGKVHVALFANDNHPGFGEALVDVRPDITTTVKMPIVAVWSDAHHDPPVRLLPVMKQIQSPDRMADLLMKQGVDLPAPEYITQRQHKIAGYLDCQIELPGGGKADAADVLAALAYLRLRQHRDEMEARSRRVTALPIKRTRKPSAPGEPVSYQEAFADLYSKLGRDYPCFELKGIDWLAVGEELLPGAEKVDNDQQFGLLCLELVARLEDCHAGLLTGTIDPPDPGLPRWDAGFACLIDDRGKPVVYHIDEGGTAEEAGVKIGMAVVSINDVPAEAAMEDCMKRITKYRGFSSDRLLRYEAARLFTRQAKEGDGVAVRMQPLDGPVETFALEANLEVPYRPRLPVPIPKIPDRDDLSWTRLEGDVGYIYVRRICGRDLVPLLDKTVGELADCRALIVDVRGNPGGGIEKKRAYRNFDPDDEQEPERPRFKGPMALLIDARCISAGEGWASWFIARRRARVFGQTTAGASSRKTIYELKNGLFKVRFPVKAYRGWLNRPIERRGLIPDVPVRQTAADLAAGRDTVLETAKQYLLETHDRPSSPGPEATTSDLSDQPLARNRIDKKDEALPKLVDQVLWWLPEDTETVNVAQSFEIPPKLSGGPGPKQHINMAQRLGCYLWLAVGSARPELRTSWKGLAGQKVSLALEGARRFRDYREFGPMHHDGCHIVVFEKDAGAEVAEFIGSLRNAAGTTLRIADQDVFVLKATERVKLDHYLTKPKSRILMCATSQDYLREILLRMAARGSKRALPSDLPEWKHLDRNAPLWAIRHFAEDVPGDKQTTGAVLAWKPNGRQVAEFKYLSTDPNALLTKVKQHWFRPGTGSRAIVRKGPAGTILITLPFREGSDTPPGFLFLLHLPRGGA